VAVSDKAKELAALARQKLRDKGYTDQQIDDAINGKAKLPEKPDA
jgi:hypothetical protein